MQFQNVQNEVVTVGNGQNCHYQPAQLVQAIDSHQKLFLTNQFVIQSLELKAIDLHLIGGYNNCEDVVLGLNAVNRTHISGMGEALALQVLPSSNEVGQQLTLENFEIRNGSSNKAGGIELNGFVSLKLINSRIHHNHSTGVGGGIHINGDGTKLDLVDSEIFNNVAMLGGGGLAISGSFNLINLKDSTVFANSAKFTGGGIDCKNNNAIDVLQTTVEMGPAIHNNRAIWGSQLLLDLDCQLQFNAVNYYVPIIMNKW